MRTKSEELNFDPATSLSSLESLPYPAVIYDNQGQIVASSIACRLEMSERPLESSISQFLPEVSSELLLEACDARVLAGIPRLIANETLLNAPTNAQSTGNKKWSITRTTLNAEATLSILSLIPCDPAGPDSAVATFQNFYRAIFEVSLDAMIVSDDRGTIVDANPAVSRLLGYTIEELVGNNLAMLMPKHYATKHDAYMSTYAQTGKANIIGIGRELEAQHRSGQKVSIKLSLAEFSQNGEKYFVGIIQDRTEHIRRLELEEFTYVLSHDFRAPLRGIHSICEWLCEDHQHNLAPEASSLVNLMRKRVANLEDLFESISRLSQIGCESESEAFIDLEACVRDSLLMIDGRDKLNVIYRAGNVKLLVHRTRLLHVIANVLDNAIKHTRQSTPEVIVTSEQHDAIAEIHFQDNGLGIEKKYRERVFLPFQSLLSKDQGAGSGIGLTIVGRAMQSYGGDAKISDSNKGTCITLAVPMWRFRSNTEKSNA